MSRESRTVKQRFVPCVLATAWLAFGACAAASEPSLAEARRWLQTGRYEEAAEAYEKLRAAAPVEAAIGWARARRAVGQQAEAEEMLRGALTKVSTSADLRAELAALAFERGDEATARKLVQEALQADAAQTAARWLDAELHRVAGELEAANRGYRWLVDYHRKLGQGSAEQLYWIGLATAQYARWNRQSSAFHGLVNTLFPAALKQDEHFWPARLATALLFLEKYNQRDAKAELDAALTINSRATEAHALRAQLALLDFDLPAAKQSLERALAINPRCLPAFRTRADVWLAELRPAEATLILEQARQLNPHDEETLGRLAVAYAVVDGSRRGDPQSREAKLTAEVAGRNAHCGEFFVAMAQSYDLLRRYPAAAACYREAERRMPQLLYTRGQLGLMLMRLGEETEAAQLLEASFADDPFNVRVKNMLEVLDVLRDYGRIETEHFVLRFDQEKDAVLAEHAARYLEREVYPELVRQLGYSPPAKSLFEIFNRAKNTSGHAWFSARMVGLPFVGTVAACAGKMVALVSPDAMPEKFNWARVLKHEFVHVVSLQQTDFHIPHWYTEGLAVRYEGQRRPARWQEVLVRRLADGKLFNLETINLGFIRPQGRDDWALAYCQSELYVEFLAEKYGADAVGRLLGAYADGLGTAAALRRCFQVEQAEFERGYRDYVARVVKAWKMPNVPPPRSLAELQRAVQDDPKNADAWAELAQQYLQRKDAASARKCAQAARQLVAKHGLGGYVLARLHLSIGDTETAVRILEESCDSQAPQENVLALLAGLRYQAGDFREAERLYRLGQERFPYADQWWKSLARVYLKTGDKAKLRDSLTWLADADGDDVQVRKKLLALALESKDYAGAVRWGTEAVHIDVTDAAGHAQLGEAWNGQQRFREAAEAWAVATRLDAERPEWHVALARARLQAGQKDKARAALEAMLQRFPGNADAKRMLEELANPPPP